MATERDSAADFERLLAEPDTGKYLLRLYVAGLTPRSADTLARIKAVCEEHLQGRYELEVIDIYQQPQLAQEHQIIVTPTLIKVLPAPCVGSWATCWRPRRCCAGCNIRRKD